MAAQPVLKRIERRPCCCRIAVGLQPLQHTGGKFAVFKPGDVGTEMQCGFRCRYPELLTHPGPGRQLVGGHAAFKRVLYLHDCFPLESRPLCGQTDLRFLLCEQSVTPEGARVGQLLPEQCAEISSVDLWIEGAANGATTVNSDVEKQELDVRLTHRSLNTDIARR
ncbi:hypothetical protein [Streptomyces sp. NPDC057794]|uniref:hypothetical protein n=1 Tax=Streptomyces sp. NPDC057794 TaxID=3346251 RepID=UPI0036759DAC